MSQTVFLRIYKNADLTEVKQFEQEQIIIGTSTEAQMTLTGDKINSLHALIERRDNGYFISDLGSDQGTLVNGKKILEQPVESGDEIQIGIYLLQFFIGVPKAITPKFLPASPKAAEPPPPKPVVAPTVAATPVVVTAPPAASPATPPSTTPAAQQKPAQKPQEPVVPKKIETKSEPPLTKTVAATASGDLKNLLKPEKGPVVEVVVAWKDRIIQTHHFSKSGSVNIGSDPNNDIVLPLVGTSLRHHKLLRIDSIAHAFVTGEMTGEYIDSQRQSKNFAELARSDRMKPNGKNFEVNISQGDMLVIYLAGGTVSLFIRYVSETPRPLMAPLLDLTASEVTGVILAGVVAAIFGLYMMIYAPEPLEETEDKANEPFRKAVVKFDPPKPKEVIVVGAETQKTVEKVPEATRPAPPSAEKAGDVGQAATLKPSPQKTKTNELQAQVNKGGGVKTGAEGANAPAKVPDTKNLGLLGVFGKKGLQADIKNSAGGTGELIGTASQATGAAGFKEDRAGGSLGGVLKNTGAGGEGTSSVGVSGPVTRGRGSGEMGYGEGGIGKKGSAKVEFGGSEEAFVGTIDREAIRRVIMEHLSEIKQCYERELNRQPDLFGKLVIEWDIIEKGQVKRAIVSKNTLGNREVANCVVNRLKTWRFPEPPEDQIARVTYPFVFAAK